MKRERERKGTYSHVRCNNLADLIGIQQTKMVTYIGACTVEVLARFRELLTFGCFRFEDGDILWRGVHDFYCMSVGLLWLGTLQLIT